MSLRKDLDAIIRSARDQGWNVKNTGRNHLAFKSPSGGTVYTASTPSDWRALANIKTLLKRYGWKETE